MARRMLMTGGTGRLGRELQKLLPELIAPLRSELDITREGSIARALDRYAPEVVIHAAAYTDVARAERERPACWEVNVTGTRRLVLEALKRHIFFIHLSTDYIFWGDTGQYREDDPPGPVRNYYALSKLVAEEVVRTLPQHLILRTSFRPSPWPYPVAFTDLFTSQDYVDVIAPEIALAILRHDEIPYRTLHIATERKSAYDLAKRRRNDVLPASKESVSVPLPDDISLNTKRWVDLKEKWKR